MKGFTLVAAVLFAFFLTTTAFSQSGRRVTTKPTPMATPRAADETPQYSESKPKASRTARIADRFPGKSSPVVERPEPKKKGAPVTPPERTVPDPPAVDDGEVLRIETNLVTVPVSVFDRNGLYIPGIRQSEFKIYEDGVEQEIEYFATTDVPFTVVLLIDVSPSTAYKIEEIQEAARAFVDQLQPQDSVMVIEFDRSVNVLTRVTTDREKIYKAIKKADFGEGTTLYGAVGETLRKHLSKITGRKAVVLFTDGVDTTSNNNTYDSTVRLAEEADSLIFPIYYNTYLDSRRAIANRGIFDPQISPVGMRAEDYAVGRKYLEDLADATGGRVFRPDATPGGLTVAFEGIAEELRRQYNIGFVPKGDSKPGQRKQLKVRVNRPNLVLRSRDSYIVGAAVQSEPAPVVKK